MISLGKAVEDYLKMRRSLGFKLVTAGTDLSKFVAFMEQEHKTVITQKLALVWAQQPTNLQPGTWAQRLGHIRGFARYYSTIDPRTEIPARGLLPFKFKRARPYIYTEQEINNLLQAALNMSYRFRTCALLPRTYYCFFGLLSVTGMRLSEVRNLKLDDVDLKVGVLTIRNTKFGKTRLVPLHASTCKILRDYIIKRKQHWKIHRRANRCESDYVFTTSRGNPLNLGHLHMVFYKLSRQVGLRGATDSHGPRIHDMRHRFATCTLINWYRAGLDPERLLPHLATYLGHADIASTQWYLDATPELMTQAMSRLEKHWEKYGEDMS